MVRARQRLGNAHTEESLRGHITTWQEEGTLDTAIIDERDAHKGRLRIQTGKGREVAILLPRGVKLETGDVFLLKAPTIVCWYNLPFLK